MRSKDLLTVLSGLDCREELKKAYELLMSRVQFFSGVRVVSSWVSWMTNEYNKYDNPEKYQQSLQKGKPTRTCFDPERNDGFEITTDGLTLRHGRKYPFSSGIATHCVKTGQ